MNKNLFIVVSVSENGKMYAWAFKVAACQNLVDVLASIKNLVTANVCDTMKAAKETASAWNEAYKRNGSYLFDVPKF